MGERSSRDSIIGRCTAYGKSYISLAHTYDRRGRQTTITQGSTYTTSLAYNDMNEVQTETYSGSGFVLAGLSVTNGFDQIARRTNVVLLNSSSTILARNTNSFDAASRFAIVGDGAGNTATYTYIANSPLVSQIVFKQGGTTRMTTTKSFDLLNRLLSISSQPSASGAAAIGYSYLYNDANQRVRCTVADGSFWVYLYDRLGQVISGRKYWPDWTPVAGQQFEYGFDDIGNRSSTKAGGDQNGLGLRLANYSANNLNQYTSRDIPGAFDVTGIALATEAVTVNSASVYRRGEYFRKEVSVANSSVPVWQSIAVAATGETTVNGNVFVPKTQEQFTYDLDGNLLTDGRWNYTWDAENRLVKMAAITSVGPQNSLQFDYDYKGRRIRKQVWSNTGWSGSPTNDVRFLYDGWNLLAVADSSSSALQSFLWGSDLSGSAQGAGGVGGLTAVNDSVQGAHFVAFDGNGNVAGLVKAADGTISASYECGPFGEVVKSSGLVAKANPFRFSTKYQDDETDLLYYGYRYYSPAQGRWINRDPDFENGGINLLAFLENAPTADADFLGLCAGNLSSNCRCGPDVTSLIGQTDASIAKAFGEVKKGWRRYSACKGITVSADSAYNWDVGWMMGMSNEGVPRCDNCQDTLTYKGNCFKRYALWYFLFGDAAKLCKKKYPTSFGDPIQNLFNGLVARKAFSHDTMQMIMDKVEVAGFFFGRYNNLSNQQPACPAATGVFPKNKIDTEDWWWRGVRKKR